MLPVLILGGIYGWFDLAPLGLDLAVRFTVTEAAAVAVVYALFVELILNRELKWRDLPGVVSESAVMMGSLFLILVIAISLNRFFVFEQVPEQATAWMLSHVDSQLTFLIMVNLFLLALGCVMDILSAILIVAPLLAPIASSYGIHPIHFGIMFIVNLELGYLTPPLGINLFVATTVFERPLIDVIRSVLPFLGLMLFCLFVIIWFPSLSLYLVE
jgi:C4-dicarboxylate transporter DctM subunit